MKNLLPNKLMMLRKHFGYSQQEIAEKLGVSLGEYMGFENGSSMCSIDQFKQLSQIFGVSLDDMIKNTDEIVLPDTSINGDSVEIPFIGGNNEPLDSTISDTSDVADNIMSFNNLAGQGVEETMATPELERTIVTKIVSDDDEVEDNDEEYEEEYEEPVKKSKPVKEVSTVRKNKANGKDKKVLIFGLVVALVAVVVIVGIMLFNKGGSSVKNTLSDTNRLVAAEKYSMFVNDNNSVSVTGSAVNTVKFTDIVQVSARGEFAIGLKKDGTVVCSASDNSACQVEKWKDIVMIAAGNNHSLGLTKDGKVECSGSGTACDVSAWTDIAKVYAGNDISIGVSKDGNIVVAGNASNTGGLTSLTNVKSVAIGGTEVVALMNDGSCKTVSLNGGNVSYTSNWSNVTQVAAGDDYVAGLKSDGTVYITSTNEDVIKEVQSWTNVKYLAGYGGYITAVTNDGKTYGAGNNSYNQYINSATESTASPTPSASAASGKLAKVSNVKFSTSLGKLAISWDSVPNASYYEVTISVGNGYTVKSAQNYLSVDASKLVSGTQYTITIIAYPENTDFEKSDAYSTSYNYVAVTPTPTPTPTATPVVQYTITWVDGNNKVVSEQKVNAGTTPSFAGTPTKDSDATNSYTFNHTWSPAVGPATSNITYYAQFDAVPLATPVPTPDCSGHGSYSGVSGTCVCLDDYTGDNCEIAPTPTE